MKAGSRRRNGLRMTARALTLRTLHCRRIFSGRLQHKPSPSTEPTMTRIYLTAVGILYILLAYRCTTAADETAAAVGLKLIGSSGQSEFITVYGGLELGLGLFFLAPLVLPKTQRSAVTACALIHLSLAIFRTGTFLTAAEPLSAMTKKLAAGEWILAISSVAMLTMWSGQRPAAGTDE